MGLVCSSECHSGNLVIMERAFNQKPISVWAVIGLDICMSYCRDRWFHYFACTIACTCHSSWWHKCTCCLMYLRSVTSFHCPLEDFHLLGLSGVTQNILLQIIFPCSTASSSPASVFSSCFHVWSCTFVMLVTVSVYFMFDSFGWCSKYITILTCIPGHAACNELSVAAGV